MKSESQEADSGTAVTLHVTADQEGQRLDRFISSHSRVSLTRHQVQRQIGQGRVLVDGVRVRKQGQRLSAGAVVKMTLPAPQSSRLVPEDSPLPIVYEDEELVVVDKPAGLVVHPAPGHEQGTLVNYLLYQREQMQEMSDTQRPGIVHRLDRDTSGLMVVAKNRESLAILQGAMKDRKVRRVYLALVVGSWPSDRGSLAAPVGRHPRKRKQMAVVEGGRPAVTRYRVEEPLDGYTLLRLELETGRTHQIRVHLSHFGHPVAGDPVYGGKGHLGLRRQALHAAELVFPHPVGGHSMQFSSPLPPDIARARLRAAVDGEKGLW